MNTFVRVKRKKFISKGNIIKKNKMCTCAYERKTSVIAVKEQNARIIIRYFETRMWVDRKIYLDRPEIVI